VAASQATHYTTHIPSRLYIHIYIKSFNFFGLLLQAVLWRGKVTISGLFGLFGLLVY
jgi:hypothetical protein